MSDNEAKRKENNYQCATLDTHRDFPGGTVVKNPLANAGDTRSSPGPGRSHMPRSPCATTTEHVCCNYRSPRA